MTGEIFLSYVRKELVPTLHSGDIVVMDNLAAHKVAGVREMIETAAATATSSTADTETVLRRYEKWSSGIRIAACRWRAFSLCLRSGLLGKAKAVPNRIDRVSQAEALKLANVRREGKGSPGPVWARQGMTG